MSEISTPPTSPGSTSPTPYSSPWDAPDRPLTPLVNPLPKPTFGSRRLSTEFSKDSTLSTTETIPEAHQTSKLSAQLFQNDESQEILDTVDQLHRCKIPGELGLPRIIIVGDQSSGKSSLLQSMTGIPFPVGEGLCTRFPTQIVSRRERHRRETTVKITIEAGGDVKPPKFDSMKLSELTEERFRDIVTKTSTFLGVSAPNHKGLAKTGGKNFSTDMLSIEISGPSCSQYKLVDLPGIFHTGTSNQTSDDIGEVRAMIQGHMKDRNTFIVCVVNALSTGPMQAIIQMAKETERAFERTIGVITRCDMIKDPHVKMPIMDVARNEEIPLALGWYVVRNRSIKELGPAEKGGISNEKRAELEQLLFQEEPWNTLERGHCGVKALEAKLATLLLEHSKKSLGPFKADVERRIAEVENEMNKLGNDRSTPIQQRVYLSSITRKFQDLATKALEGRYSEAPSLTEEMKICKLVADANDAFARAMLEDGHMAQFNTVETESLNRDIPHETPNVGLNSPSENGLPIQMTPNTGTFHAGKTASAFRGAAGSGGSQAPSGSTLFGTPVPVKLPPTPQAPPGSTLFGTPVPVKLPPTPQAPSGSTLFGTPVPVKLPPTPQSDQGTLNAVAALSPSQQRGWRPTTDSAEPSLIDLEIRKAIIANRGTELPGTVNPEVFPALFLYQTGKWRAMAIEHCNKINGIVQFCFKAILASICDDKGVELRILPYLQDFDAKAVTIAEGKFLNIIESIQEKPTTWATNFPDMLKQARLVRFQNALARYLKHNPADALKSIVQLDVERLFEHLHGTAKANLEWDIHDTLKTFYDLKLEWFSEAVLVQVVKQYVSHPDGPFKAFSSEWIGTLDDETLGELAAESTELAKSRTEKTQLLMKLREGQQILRQKSHLVMVA